MPKGKPKAAATNGAAPAAKAAGEKKVTKMAAMRLAIKALGRDASPKDLQGHIEKEHGLTMSYDMASTYKGSVLKEFGTRKKPGPKPGQKREVAMIAIATAAPAASAITLDDIRAVKTLADKIGATKVQQLATVLAK